jgi:hypothetical protein
MRRTIFFLFTILLITSSEARAEFPAQASNKEILRAIHQANDLLNVSEKAWVDKV